MKQARHRVFRCSTLQRHKNNTLSRLSHLIARCFATLQWHPSREQCPLMIPQHCARGFVKIKLRSIRPRAAANTIPTPSIAAVCCSAGAESRKTVRLTIVRMARRHDMLATLSMPTNADGSFSKLMSTWQHRSGPAVVGLPFGLETRQINACGIYRYLPEHR
jgi:hypothetical protein